MSKKQRRTAIIKALSDLSRNGWANARPYDYEPLEAELRKLAPVAGLERVG
jgi:hypothetical protein